MKTIACAAIFALFLMSIATPLVTSAHASGSSANGTYRVVFEDNLARTVEFEAQSEGGSSATGQMTFRDEAGSFDQDPDAGEERPGDPPTEFYMTADLNTLTIENNRALMGGTIRDSSNRDYIGRWVQLVVEDNGNGGEVPDKLSWRFCQPEPGGWTPQDAEDPRDEGAWWQWWATDAEREDDRGVQSENIIPGTRQGCPTFPISSYEFPDARGEGQIQVQP